MKKYILATALLLLSQSTYAVENETVQNNLPPAQINIDLDDEFVKAVTFENLTNTTNNVEKTVSFKEEMEKATERYTQTNVVAAYKDFSNIINSQENKNDFLYITIAQRLNEMGFFTLSQSAIIHIVDNDLWHSVIESMKRTYNPAVTLTYDEEIYLVQHLTATLYNNSAKETIKSLEDNDKLLKKSDYANYVLAVSYFENKNYSKAMNSINKALSKAPDCINYQLFKEKIYAQTENYKNALKIIEDIEKNNFLNNHNKNTLLADKYYILMKTTRGEKSKIYSAKLLLLKKDNQKALKELQTIIGQNKKNAEAYTLLGDFYISEKNPAKAIEYFQKALEINKKYAPAIMGIGHYYFLKKDYTKSLEYYENAYKYDPQNEQNLLCLVNNSIIINNTEKANLYLKKVLKINQNSDSAYYFMSILVPEMKEQYLRKTINLNSANVHAWLDLAEIKIQQNNYKKAEEYLLPVKILEPSNTKYIHLRQIVKSKGNKDISSNNHNEEVYKTFL